MMVLGCYGTQVLTQHNKSTHARNTCVCLFFSLCDLVNELLKRTIRKGDRDTFLRFASYNILADAYARPYFFSDTAVRCSPPSPI